MFYVRCQDILDVHSGECLTDGSGFISKDLADQMPQLVMQGRNQAWERQLYPAVFQVEI